MTLEIEFVDEKERELFARARLGESVHAFLRSDAGRYIHGRCRLELEDIKEQLLDCNLWTFLGRRRAKKLQEDAAVARKVMRFCADAIMDGEVAYQELTQYQNSDS